MLIPSERCTTRSCSRDPKSWPSRPRTRWWPACSALSTSLCRRCSSTWPLTQTPQRLGTERSRRRAWVSFWGVSIGRLSGDGALWDCVPRVCSGGGFGLTRTSYIYMSIHISICIYIYIYRYIYIYIYIYIYMCVYIYIYIYIYKLAQLPVVFYMGWGAP